MPPGEEFRPLLGRLVLFTRAVEAGTKLATLFDMKRDASGVVRAVLGGSAAVIGAIRRKDGAQVRPEDLIVSISYWGGAKGRWKRRAPREDDRPLSVLGEETGDFFINEETAFFNVPERTWSFQVGCCSQNKMGLSRAFPRVGATNFGAARKQLPVLSD